MPPTKKVKSKRNAVPSTKPGKRTTTERTRLGKVAPSRGKSVPRKQPTRRTPIAASSSLRNQKSHRTRVPGQKRYRRIKVFRPCVIRLAFLVPIAILAIERYLGFVISLDDVRETYYDQMGIDPWELPLSKSERLGKVIDLTNLTHTPQIRCPNGQRRMMTVHNPQFYGLGYRNVPNIIHQTAKTRCLTRSFDRASILWAFRKYSYYIHDMDAVTRLVNSDFPEFPQLRLLTDSCLPPALLVGLWKYLVLWRYGGILADLNTFPSHFNATTISNEDDGFFLLEEGSNTLSTLVMGVSPRHPLMYYAIQHSTSNILKMREGVMYNPREIVGEGALQQALTDFRRASTKHGPWTKKGDLVMREGKLTGVHGRSIRIGGTMSGKDDAIVTPIFNSRAGKREELEHLSMEDYEDAIPGCNCITKLVKEVN